MLTFTMSFSTSIGGSNSRCSLAAASATCSEFWTLAQDQQHRVAIHRNQGVLLAGQRTHARLELVEQQRSALEADEFVDFGEAVEAHEPDDEAARVRSQQRLIDPIDDFAGRGRHR